MRRVSLAIAGLAVLMMSMCRPSVGTFTAHSYAHPKYPYSIRYYDPGSQALMPPDWKLDNFYLKGRRLAPKTGAEYESNLLLDTNGDGTHEDLGKVQTFDLRFTHKRNAGVIWIRTIPIDVDLRDRELRVMADGIVESITGAGYETVQVEGQLKIANNERRYAAQPISRSAAKLAGLEAHAITLDIANLDQRKVDPNSVEARVMLVLARSPFEYSTGGMGRAQKFPVVMLAGYANSVADFEASIKDFTGLLERLQVAGASGFSQEDATSASAEAMPDAAAPAVTPDAAPPATPTTADAGATEAAAQPPPTTPTPPTTATPKAPSAAGL